MKFDKLNIGDTVYVAFIRMGIVAVYTYAGFENNSHKFVSNKNEFHVFRENVVFETEDEARLSIYLYKLKLLQDKIRKTTKLLEEHTKEISNLNSSYEYLRDKFPEEFL